MALDYATTASLMADIAFRDRVKVACLHFSDYILGEDRATPAHNTRMKWAATTYQLPDDSAAKLMPVVVMDPKVQESGRDITDADLQSAVETSVNKVI